MASAKKAAKRPAKPAAKPKSAALRDQGEDIAQMEPMLVGEQNAARGELLDLVFDLTKRSASFRASDSEAEYRRRG
jgi:hypothetical protein